LTPRTWFVAVPPFPTNSDSVDQFLVKHSHPRVEPLVFFANEALEFIEPRIDLIESRIDLLESCIDLLESCIDLLESCIHVATKRGDLARQCLTGDYVLERRYSFFQGPSCHRASCAPACREARAEGSGAKTGRRR
jgi:hypothetical protein